jgi:serine/threonine protein kinase
VDLDTAEDVRPEKTADTVVVGTAATAAPEQFGFRRCDERTDVYAIGMLLLYLLSGEYTPSALKNASVAKPLRRIIDKSLQFDPRKRYDSVDRLMKRLISVGRHGDGRVAAAVLCFFWR